MGKGSMLGSKKDDRVIRRAATIQILIAEDHALVRDGLAAILAEQPDFRVVAVACNGREAADLFDRHQPDITLMDLRMPLLDGPGAVRAIREKNPGARVIMLTAYAGQEDIYRSLEAGASGYLLKSATGDQLFRAIRAAHAGELILPPDLAHKMAERMASRQLSDREMQVLAGMAEGKSNSQIGESLLISEGTVKCHVNNVFQKLEVNDRTKAVLLAIRRGLIQL